MDMQIASRKGEKIKKKDFGIVIRARIYVKFNGNLRLVLLLFTIMSSGMNTEGLPWALLLSKYSHQDGVSLSVHSSSVFFFNIYILLLRPYWCFCKRIFPIYASSSVSLEEESSIGFSWRTLCSTAK